MVYTFRKGYIQTLGYEFLDQPVIVGGLVM